MGLKCIGCGRSLPMNHKRVNGVPNSEWDMCNRCDRDLQEQAFIDAYHSINKMTISEEEHKTLYKNTNLGCFE